MHTLPAVRLLSTDFDGTLIYDTYPPVVPELFDALRDLRAAGVQWVVNTGRNLQHIEDGLRHQYHFPVEPDYVVVEERDIYRRTRKGGWEPLGDWNIRGAAHLNDLFRLAGPLLSEVLAFLEQVPGASPIYEQGRFIGAVTCTIEEMDQICVFLGKLRDGLPLFNFQRNTIYVRFCHQDYSKGTALAEINRHLGFAAEEVFAVGDHHNDLPMLDRRFAHYVACPGNSCEEVKLAVRTAGGYLAEGAASAGVVEALRHFGIWK